METMTLTDEDEKNAFARLQTSSRAKELELGGGGATRDSFGNTLNKSQQQTKQKEKELEQERKAARERREAKAAAELAAEASSGKKSKGGTSNAEQMAALEAKEAAGAKLSNGEVKRLKAHREALAQEAEERKEYESGLANFSVSVQGGFNADETDSSLSSVDVIVPCFSCQAPHRTLFDNAELRLVSGNRYGLLGANGSGKTTLMKMLAARRLPVPATMSIHLVEQEVKASSDTLVEQLLSSDEARTRLLAQEAALLAQLGESEGDGGDDEEGEAEEAEEENEQEGKKMAAAVAQLQAVGAEIDALGLYGAEAKARRILSGLGFSSKQQDSPEGSTLLSGGWRMRVALGRALFMAPHLLLLDEPTSHLDLEAVIWLETYLSEECKATTTVTVSHDQDFLDATSTHVLHVDMCKLTAYAGNVASFRSMRGQIESKKQRDYSLQQKTVKELVTKGLTQAKAEVRAQEKLGVAALMAVAPKEYYVNFVFQPSGDSFPSISLLDAGFKYPGKLAPAMFRQLRFNIGSTSRVCLVGANGSGKSTLLSIMTGALEPTEGNVSLHSALRLGIYNQHFEDRMDLNQTPIQFLEAVSLRAGVSLGELDARKFLGMFGLDGTRHKIKIGELSGGQKARVVFASLSVMRAHILILDEPSNFLDGESVDALIAALKEFEGGVVVVTHDSRLVRALDCEVWECTGGLLDRRTGIEGTGLRVEHRGFEHYRSMVLAKIRKEAAAATAAAEEEVQRRKAVRQQRLQRLAGRGGRGGLGAAGAATDNPSTLPPPPASSSSSTYKFKAKGKPKAANVKL